LGERLVCNQEVVGSNPIGSTRLSEWLGCESGFERVDCARVIFPRGEVFLLRSAGTSGTLKSE
jgi:hypothetical protein